MRIVKFFQAVKMAGYAIWCSKLRSFLTMLGIIIGVASLVVLVSLVNGATTSVTDEIAGMGNDLLTVDILDDKGSPMKWKEMEQVEEADEIALAAPLGQTNATGEYGNTSGRLTLYGTTAAYGEIQGLDLSSGRFLKNFDVENHTSVAVINQAAAEEYFEQSQAVGEYLGINGRKFLIVGVLLEKESVTGNVSEKLEAYIPYTALMRISDSVSDVTRFYVKAEEEISSEQAELSLQNVLLDRFSQDEEAFTIVSQSAVTEAMENVTNTFALLLGGIAAISLVVGGIGIMNIMLVSVTERTREIGIRKAIGASRGSIMLQFMMEALLISLLGCVVGVGVSALALRVVSLVSGSEFQMSLQVLAVAVGFSAAIGLLSGIYPANQAARKHPIEALRYTD